MGLCTEARVYGEMTLEGLDRDIDRLLLSVLIRRTRYWMVGLGIALEVKACNYRGVHTCL